MCYGDVCTFYGIRKQSQETGSIVHKNAFTMEHKLNKFFRARMSNEEGY